MEIERIDARRIFVIENNQEYNEWEETFDLHHRCNFQARYILLKDYNRILKDLSKGSCELTNVKGFNIIDSGIIDIVVNWNYRNRSTDGATIKKGLGVSNEFTKLFNTLWRSAKEIEKRPKLERSKDLDLSYEKV